MHSLLSHLKLPFKRRQKATSVLIHSRPHELPLELIEEILHHVYTDLTRYDGRPSVFRTEFRSLVLVSQAWYSAGIALLYAEPYLPSFHSLSSFSRTVSRQPALASHVRTLALTLEGEDGPFTSIHRLALRVAGKEETKQTRVDRRMMKQFRAIVTACTKIDAIYLPPLRDPVTFKLPSSYAPSVPLRLRRLTLYGWRNNDPLPFTVNGTYLSSVNKPTVSLDLEDLEEFNITRFLSLVHYNLPPLRSLRTLRVIDSWITSFTPLITSPRGRYLPSLRIIELRGNYIEGHSIPMGQCMDTLQFHAPTLQKLVLVGPVEMRMARSLNLAKFTALERLTIGYVRDGELPLEDVAIPPALQILVVHWWDDDHSRKLTKVEFSFSSEAVMEDFLRHEASAEVAKLPKDGRLTVSILGPAQPSLVGLCNDRGIQLFVSPRVSGEPTTGNIGLQSHVLRWTSAHISIV